MKKVVILTFCILSCFSYVNAQDYNEYLSVARQHLADGNIEKAQKAYSTYCLLSDSRDLSFEKELEKLSAKDMAGRDFVETAAGLNMKMVWVEGGEFLMGGTSEQGSEAEIDEQVIRRVELSSYYIGECEITQSQWEKVMGISFQERVNKYNISTLYGVYGVGHDYPMYYVGWETAQAFCQELSRMTGRTYCLPTEAQWEYAARGGKNNDGTKYSGSWSIDAVAWYDDNSTTNNMEGPHPVKMKRPNSLGLYDMSGNVAEWCSDIYDNYDVNDINNPNPKHYEPDDEFPDYVVRGGSCWDPAHNCRVSARHSYFSYLDRMPVIGFRVAVLP